MQGKIIRDIDTEPLSVIAYPQQGKGVMWIVLPCAFFLARTGTINTRE